MRRVVVTNNLSLDGVMQAPGRPGEDDRGGFDRGGWAGPYDDAVKGQAMGKGMATSGGLLLGRRTYEDLYSVWPGRTDNPFTEVLDNATKHVASRTLTAPLPWQNSVLLEGDVADAVAALKETEGGDLTVLGSGDLLQSIRHLVDAWVLCLHPLLLGKGRRLFEDGVPADLALVDSVTTTTGVIVATYERR